MNITLDIEEHDLAELNSLKLNSQDYEPDSLGVMIAALNRHLKEKRYPLSIVIKGSGIPLIETGLEGKAKLLQQASQNKHPSKARNLTKEED